VTEYSEMQIRQSPTASRGIVWDVPVEEQREALRAYYASISFMDAQVGRLLDALRRLGLDNNTVIVFVSDHGYHLGDHGGLWMKQSLFERSTRTPMIVAGPGVSAGGVSRRIVELLDLYPTVAGLAGVAAPAGLEGRSLAPLLKDPDMPWERPALSQSRRPLANLAGTGRRGAGPPQGLAGGRGEGAAPAVGQAGRGRSRQGGGQPDPPAVGYSIRTERWRYIEWDEGRLGQELYDVANDSGELKNLAAEPDYASAVAEMKASLAATRGTRTGR
jgi:arylsulfatase A-like enzyme